MTATRGTEGPAFLMLSVCENCDVEREDVTQVRGGAGVCDLCIECAEFFARIGIAVRYVDER